MNSFVERAARLERSAYLKRIYDQGGTETTVHWDRQNGVSVTHNFPNEEEIDALMLTARMFVQDNDQVSLRNMSRLVADPGISLEWKERLADARDGLNAFLDAPSLIHENGKKYTNREVFDVFLYGGLAHTNRNLAPIYKRWNSNPISSATCEVVFHGAVYRLVGTAIYLAHWTKEELAGRPIPPFEDEPAAS